MATNPMQRKARNSFLLGILVATLVAAVVIALLAVQLVNTKKKEKLEEASAKTVYVLNKDIKSGDPVTLADVTATVVRGDIVPSNYAAETDFTVEEKMTEDGKQVSVEQVIAKIDIGKGSVLSRDMINKNTENTTADLRTQEYNMIALPTTLAEGDYIDIRLTLPNGQDYLVVSKKKVMAADADTISINLNEDETLTMSNAIVEAYIMTGSKLYAATYVEPGIQKTALPTYPVSAEVASLMEADPNIVATASTALARYATAGTGDKQKQQRNDFVNKALNQYSENAQENIDANVKDYLTKQKTKREEYIKSLEAGAAGTTGTTSTTTNTTSTNTTN